MDYETFKARVIEYVKACGGNMRIYFKQYEGRYSAKCVDRENTTGGTNLLILANSKQNLISVGWGSGHRAVKKYDAPA